MNKKEKQPTKKWDEMTKKEKRNVIITLVVIALIVIAIISNLSGGNKTPDTTATIAKPTTTIKAPEAPTPAPKVPTRQAAGTLTTLGAGTFDGGKDVPVGLYDVTPGAGESGNFMVSGTDSYNEILGTTSSLGVSKVRVNVSDGDSIQISGLSQVTFTPVTSAFVTAYSTETLYSGTFTVDEDLAAGRYVVTPGAGESGNFMVSGTDSYNEILGSKGSYGQVPSVSVSLTSGDTIVLSGMNHITFTAK